ncbi:hypothetical protein EGT36_21445 [Agrobacterium sp. FDAARGOS_525]|nr:hypothetical protein EGT36_21445 [Agrobacterium sp. FDAARGOS_525]
MPRGGYRPGAGRPKTAKVQTKVEVRREANKAKMTPLEYMLSVMNDVEAEDGRRDRMAVAAAPFVHARADEGKLGKKAERLGRAEQASSAGKFAVRNAPKLVVDNK